jgi:hypothetical protein
MTGFQYDDEYVRKVAPGEYLAPPPARSKYQARRDADLDEIEASLRQARDLIDDALEGFGMYADVQHRNLGVLVSQQIEQVIEFRRIKQ